MLGNGTQRSKSPGEDDPIPIHESVDQELQVDTAFSFGQVFFMSISVLMGLIITTHLGPYHATTHSERCKSRAGTALIDHINKYQAHGFTIKCVTTDGEPAIRAAKTDIEQMGVQINVLGHGS